MTVFNDIEIVAARHLFIDASQPKGIPIRCHKKKGLLISKNASAMKMTRNQVFKKCIGCSG